MNALVVLTCIIGIYSRVDADDNIDGNKLAQELRKIKEDIGINYMQEQFNNFPYETKSDTGNQLLQRIQLSLDTSLNDLNLVINDVYSKIVTVHSSNPDSTSTSFDRCCDLQDNALTYLPEFQSKVDLNKACVTTSPIAVTNLKYPTEQIGETMKTNYEYNKNVLWQHYSTTEGVSVIYPATKWHNCQNFDPRFKSSYAAAASPTDKDVVIVIDTSSSMRQPSGVIDKTKIVIAKEAANNVLQTLKPNDRIGIVRFDKNAYTPAGDNYHSCYENQLAFATKENTDKLKQYVFSIVSGDFESNFANALLSAFNYYNSTDEDVQVENREQIILFISDGMSSSGKDPVQVISDENSKYNNKITIFTYLIGQDESAKVQFQSMANQDLYNPSVGPKQIGHFEYFDQTNQQYLSTRLATFYEHLSTGSPTGESTFTVPYVDPFSGVGLITSLCRRVHVSTGFHGVMCTDVKISKLLTEIEYFSEDEFTYAFLIDGTGRALMHPLLPNAAFVKSTEDPVLLDISVLEREEKSKSVIESMKRGGTGSKSFAKFFTKPRGKLVNDGSSDISRQAHFFWGPIPNSNFSVCVVLVNESYAEMTESQFPLSDADFDNVFMNHDRSLLTDSFSNCKFYKRRVTLDRSCVKFSQAAFENPFQYLDRDETARDISKYKDFLTKTSVTNPGFHSTLRASVWASYKAEQFWKTHPATYVAWRYIATKAGLIRVYPGVLLLKSYDHEKRAWWRQTMAHPDTMFLSTPYVDAWGSGIVLSFVHTIHKKGSNIVTAAAGADFPLEYFNWFITSVYPSCGDNSGYRCIIVDDSGFVVMHPRLKETTEESAFEEPKHITVEEPGIANILKREGVLNSKDCQDYSTNKDLFSYRVTVPSGKSSGLDFADTDNTFEIRPITDTNLFIIRSRSSPASSTCTCDGSKSPDVVECKNNCNCLCHRPIIYDVCANKYNTESATLPCSARLPDTSGVSEPDVTDGLKACNVPTCHLKSTNQDCFSESECSWCEYTDIGEQIETPCCRLKEECTFGKTKSTKRDTCAPVTTTTTTKAPPVTESSKMAAIVGGSIAAGILIVLLVYGMRRYCQYYQKTHDNVDPYLHAIPDNPNELHQLSEKDEFSGKDRYPPPYQSGHNPNFYVDNTGFTGENAI